jgi:hypothetical protein
VIKKDSTWKGIFDLTLLLISCYNIFSNAFYSAFGIPESIYFTVIDNFVEGLFWFDLIFCFCQEYLDEETYTIVSDIKRISKHYLTGTFFIDLLACLPIENIRGINEESVGFEMRLFRLLKLLRFPRLA